MYKDAMGAQYVQEANSLIWEAMNKLIFVIALSITAACLLWATGCSTSTSGGGTYTRPRDPQFNTARDQ
jgi:hypothetical protein